MAIGIGPTESLSLRVSVATLSHVSFIHPESGARMLALEHKAHSHSSSDPADIFLQAQPFGGGARLLDPNGWLQRLGEFHFDSQRSREERDFRIFVDPARWQSLKRVVVEEAALVDSSLIDTNPARELQEEFEDTLGYQLRPEQYTHNRTGVAVENEPAPTHSWRAPGRMTARIYCLDQITITDDELVRLMLAASQRQTPEYLLRLARQRAEASGHGRANGIFITPLTEIRRAYQALEPPARGEPLPFGNTLLSSNVVALLERIDAPKYVRVQLGEYNSER